MQYITNHPFGPNGPYYRHACMRDRFPSLLDEVGPMGDSLVLHLGSSNIENMNGRLKSGHKHKHTKEEELRDAYELDIKNLKEHRLKGLQERNTDCILEMKRYVAVHLKRACDKYAPRKPRCQPRQEDMSPERRRSRSVPVLPTAKRQSGEPPYEGKCDHCRRQGSDDVLSDSRARSMAKRICEQRVLRNQHQLLHAQHNRSLNAGFE